VILDQNTDLKTEIEPLFNKEHVSVGTRVVGPCHHGMARPQVADRGTASDMEGSCE